MKPFLYGALTLSLVSAPALAQDAATPPASFANAPLQTDAARLLTAEFVRSAIYIGSGVLAERKAGEPLPGITTLDEKKSVAALQKATGLSFARLSEWRKWWDEEGSKMEWK